MSRCSICGNEAQPVFRECVLGKYDAEFFRCRHCGYLWAADPHWLNEAYADAIVAADTGIVQRNISVAQRLANLIFFCLEPGGRYVDVAGGYGLLVRMMRDFGFDFYWEDRYAQNLVARGFEYSKTEAAVTGVTAIEVLEHTVDPLAFVRDCLDRFSTDTIILTTELYAGDAPPPGDWWYYSFNTGQHISFFQRSTLEHMAATLGLQFSTWSGFHVLTRRRLRNRFAAPVLANRLVAPLSYLVRRTLGSKTIPDNRICLQRTAADKWSGNRR